MIYLNAAQISPHNHARELVNHARELGELRQSQGRGSPRQTEETLRFGPPLDRRVGLTLGATILDACTGSLPQCAVEQRASLLDRETGGRSPGFPFEVRARQTDLPTAFGRGALNLVDQKKARHGDEAKGDNEMW